jgi:choline dehydrogenase-like flavoprotein
VSDAYLKPVLDRPNLTVAVNSQVTQILFDGTRAFGVAYVRDGSENKTWAQAEVILSGGTINSPQLLLLSPIGPAEQLRAHGIPVRMDLPGGRGQSAGSHDDPNRLGHTGFQRPAAAGQPGDMTLWQERRGGPFSSNGSDVGGLCPST